MNEIIVDKISKYFDKRIENDNAVFSYEGPVPQGYDKTGIDVLRVDIKIDKLTFVVSVTSLLGNDTAKLIKYRLIDIIKEYCIENGIILYNKDDGFRLIDCSEVIAITEKTIPMQLN